MKDMKNKSFRDFRDFCVTLNRESVNRESVNRDLDPDISHLEEALKAGVCRFIFMKKDGSVREAHGTRNLALIPTEHHPHGVRQPSPDTLGFFDTDKGEWRCLRRDRFVGMTPQN